jgi:hypothetical protein
MNYNKFTTMKTSIIILAAIAFSVISCNKENMIDDPAIKEFSVDKTSFPKRDTITFTINAVGETITFFDGKAMIDLSTKTMPYTHKVGRIRFSVTPPADTIYATLTAVNVYSADVVKQEKRKIELILLD